MSRDKRPPRLSDKLSTLQHLRGLMANVSLPWVHGAEWYHGRPDEPDCCAQIPGDYRWPIWGGSEVLCTPDSTCEDLDQNEMAFAAAASITLPLLVDLYEAVLKARPNTRNPADPVELALSALDGFAPGVESTQ